jgi:hypothetical protein
MTCLFLDLSVAGGRLPVVGCRWSVVGKKIEDKSNFFFSDNRQPATGNRLLTTDYLIAACQTVYHHDKLGGFDGFRHMRLKTRGKRLDAIAGAPIRCERYGRN